MRDRFTAEMKEALKAGDKRKLATVRLIQAALKDKDIEARGAGRGQASDEEILGLLQKMIKQRQESMDIYEKNGMNFYVWESESTKQDGDTVVKGTWTNIERTG